MPVYYSAYSAYSAYLCSAYNSPYGKTSTLPYGAYGYESTYEAHPYAYEPTPMLDKPSGYAYSAVVPLGARYYANSGGAVHIVKREAETEAVSAPEAAAEADANANYACAVYGHGYNASFLLCLLRLPLLRVQPPLWQEVR